MSREALVLQNIDSFSQSIRSDVETRLASFGSLDKLSSPGRMVRTVVKQESYDYVGINHLSAPLRGDHVPLLLPVRHGHR